MSSKNNLTSEQYIAAKTKWASGNYRLKDLAEEFGISITAFNRRFARDGIKKGQDRQKHEKAISEAVEGTMIANSQRVMEMIIERKEHVHRINEHIEKRALNLVMEATKANKPLATVADDVKVLKMVQDIMANGYQITKAIFNVDKLEGDTEIPTVLRVETLTEEEVREIKEDQQKQVAELLEGDFDEGIVITSPEDKDGAITNAENE